jgi:transmembrane sensor
MDQSYWKEQLQKYRTRSLTSAEEKLLWEAWADTTNTDGWKQIMRELFSEQEPTIEYQNVEWESLLQAVFDSDRTEQASVVRRMPFIRRFALAAAIASGLLVGGYWLVTRNTKNDRPIVAQTTHLTDVPPPATNRATITLSNGQQVYLDSSSNGTLARQGNAQVTKLAKGQVVYKAGNAAGREVFYNTLSNPRGSQIVTLTLSDGTKVWLNAASSIRYPVVFSGQDRVVEMTGEGYFEVVKNASKPFKVTVKDRAEVQVLGTSFNINAYEDEPTIKTTLLDGSVRVAAARTQSLVGVDTNDNKLSFVLKPGQQAQIVPSVVGVNTNNKIRLVNDVDVDGVVAWKNGRFAFSHADLYTVMRQLARWYDLSVSYEGEIPKRSFNGTIVRSLTLNQLLTGLARSQVHFTIEPGNKLIIRP